MTEKILIVTPPDDILLQGIRILHIDLDDSQGSVVSDALMQTSLSNNIINYVWKMGNRVDWLLDKTPKCDLIFFNAGGAADPGRDLIMGWISAQPQSYYFGILKDLHLVNDRAIYSAEDVVTLLEKVAKKYV
jgi:hypothetical protein